MEVFFAILMIILLVVLFYIYVAFIFLTFADIVLFFRNIKKQKSKPEDKGD